ncbi:hypothetical protein BX265_6151 [Streptomyces sp. TLI_235]|nr:hypothetical protein [Streptomyces sp. TLI_235]PBC71541.1 hypothetical protein BX265_6151 [Streptomyces sp. TLI_235]
MSGWWAALPDWAQTALAALLVVAVFAAICRAHQALDRREVIRRAERILRNARRPKPKPARQPDRTAELFAIPRPDPTNTED